MKGLGFSVPRDAKDLRIVPQARWSLTAQRCRFDVVSALDELLLHL